MFNEIKYFLNKKVLILYDILIFDVLSLMICVSDVLFWFWMVDFFGVFYLGSLVWLCVGWYGF